MPERLLEYNTLASCEHSYLVVANTVASLALGNESETEQQWLERTFAMIEDTLRKTQAYQKILQEGLEEGHQKGLQQGRQEALQQELERERQVLLDIIIERFPQIVRQLQKQIDIIDDPSILLGLIVKMSKVQTAEEARQLLRDVTQSEE